MSESLTRLVTEYERVASVAVHLAQGALNVRPGEVRDAVMADLKDLNQQKARLEGLIAEEQLRISIEHGGTKPLVTPA